jgi:hypothetical protein
MAGARAAGAVRVHVFRNVGPGWGRRSGMGFDPSACLPGGGGSEQGPVVAFRGGDRSSLSETVGGPAIRWMAGP